MSDISKVYADLVAHAPDSPFTVLTDCLTQLKIRFSASQEAPISAVDFRDDLLASMSDVLGTFQTMLEVRYGLLCKTKTINERLIKSEKGLRDIIAVAVVNLKALERMRNNEETTSRLESIVDGIQQVEELQSEAQTGLDTILNIPRVSDEHHKRYFSLLESLKEIGVTLKNRLDLISTETQQAEVDEVSLSSLLILLAIDLMSYIEHGSENIKPSIPSILYRADGQPVFGVAIGDVVLPAHASLASYFLRSSHSDARSWNAPSQDVAVYIDEPVSTL